MASFELRVELADLPNTLTAMREWLDHHKSNITHFRSESDAAGMVTINVGFNLQDDHLEAFRQRFSANRHPLKSELTRPSAG